MQAIYTSAHDIDSGIPHKYRKIDNAVPDAILPAYPLTETRDNDPAIQWRLRSHNTNRVRLSDFSYLAQRYRRYRAHLLNLSTLR